MAKVLSIEVGYSLTKVCEVDFKTKNPKVYSSFTIKTPESIMEDGLIRVPDELAEKIKLALEENGIKTKQVVYTVTSSKIASREAVLPFVKENKLEELVSANAGDYFPVDLTDFKITYQTTEIVTAEDGVKQYKLMIFVAPNELLESYYTLSQKAGLTVVALDYSGNSLCAAVKDVMTTGTRMVMKVDESSSILTVFKEGAMGFQRTVPYGGDAAVDTVIEAAGETTQMTYEAALELLRNKICMNRELTKEPILNIGEPKEEVDAFKENVTESVSILVNSILRVLDYYNSRNSDKPVEEVFLTGYAENFSELTLLMSNELGLPVRRLSELQELTFMQGLSNGGEYISCIGAAIAPMDFIPDIHNEKKRKEIAKKKKTEDGVPQESMRIPILICAGSIAISIVLSLVSVIPYVTEQVLNKALKEKEAELAPIEVTYAQYTDMELQNRDLLIMYESTRRPNDRILDFLEELQMKLPYGSNVLSFTSGDTNVTLTMNVESMEAAALTVMELRKFDCLETANIAAVSQEIDEETGTVSVNFTLECTYAPLEYDIPGVEMIPAE